MTATILAFLEQRGSAPGVLRAATHLAGLLGEAAIHVLVVRMPAEATILPSEEILTSRSAARIRQLEAARAAELTAVVQNWREQVALTVRCTDVEAMPAEAVAEQGGRAEYLVMARPDGMPHGADMAALHATLFATKRPVLLVPQAGGSAFGRCIAVAWRDDTHATAAVLAAMPLLAQADAVHVLHGARDGIGAEPVPPIFSEHAVTAQMHVLAIGSEAFGATLLHEAHASGADLLVMGAYSHNPMREMLFGGVTRYMLEHADLPILLCH